MKAFPRLKQTDKTNSEFRFRKERWSKFIQRDGRSSDDNPLFRKPSSQKCLAGVLRHHPNEIRIAIFAESSLPHFGMNAHANAEPRGFAIRFDKIVDVRIQDVQYCAASVSACLSYTNRALSGNPLKKVSLW